MASDAWDPAQYDRFGAERRQPFFDPLLLVEARPGLRAVDLGCGTAENTAELHRRLACAATLGIDASAAMLATNAAFAAEGLRFQVAHVEDTDACAPAGTRIDLIFSNACLHWVPDHDALFPRLAAVLDDGGRLAVQVPVNHDHPSHVLATELARETPFRAALGDRAASPVLPVERYARILHVAGFVRQRVFVQVYAHLLGSRDDVVEWVKGSLVTVPRARLDPALYAEFESRYRDRLRACLADDRPFPYTFKRLLL